jgi:hypothetical protein
MNLAVTGALGATAATITISYTDQANNAAQSTGAIALTTSAAANRLVPVQDGPMIRLAAGDYGVRTVEGCILSASMLAGTMAVQLFKPLRLQTTLLGLPVEMTTPVQAGRMTRVTQSAGGELPCIMTQRYVQTSGAGLHGLAEFVWGPNNSNTFNPHSNSTDVCVTAARGLQRYATEAAFKAHTDTLVADGNTQHDIGMIWGARLLSQDGIFGPENAVVASSSSALTAEFEKIAKNIGGLRLTKN